MKTLFALSGLGLAFAAAMSAQSLLVLSDPMTSSDSNWTQNGPGTYSSSGLTSSTAATLVSTSAPATGNNYEIRMQPRSHSEWRLLLGNHAGHHWSVGWQPAGGYLLRL